MLDLLINYGIITFASFISFEYNFLLKLITLDGLFTAIRFLRMFINKNLTESQVVTQSNSLYCGSWLDRCIYYISLYGIYKILCTFFWISDSYLLYYISMLTIMPVVINKILESKLFQLIREKKELLIKMVISKIFTAIIKFYSKMYLDRDINIKHSEILILLKDYKDTVTYFVDVLKNLFIILILSYVKNYLPALYYGIIKYAYNYKTGDLLASYNNTTAKDYLIDIIDNKKWGELTKPNTYKAILHLYQINDEKSDVFKKIVNDFNFSLIKMFTLWTLCSLLDCIYLVPFGSLMFILFRKYFRNETNDKIPSELFVILLGIIMSYLYPSYMIISAICQFGSKILFNKLTFVMLKVGYKFFRKALEKIINNNNELIVSYIVTILYSLILKHLTIQEGYIMVCINMLANVMMNIEIKKQVIIGIVISTSYISHYNLLHVLFNSLVLYIVNGMIDRSNMYTFQDTLKLLIDNLSLILNNIIDIILMMLHYIYDHYMIVRHYIRDRVKTTIFSMPILKKNKQNKLIFDLMDTERFPSISLENSEALIKNKNNIKKEIIDIEESVSFDDKIFDQSEDIFINGISIDEKDVDEYVVYERKSRDDYVIINDYFK